jgi:hypothetical protein
MLDIVPLGLRLLAAKSTQNSQKELMTDIEMHGTSTLRASFAWSGSRVRVSRSQRSFVCLINVTNCLFLGGTFYSLEFLLVLRFAFLYTWLQYLAL